MSSRATTQKRAAEVLTLLGEIVLAMTRHRNSHPGCSAIVLFEASNRNRDQLHSFEPVIEGGFEKLRLRGDCYRICRDREPGEWGVRLWVAEFVGRADS